MGRKTAPYSRLPLTRSTDQTQQISEISRQLLKSCWECLLRCRAGRGGRARGIPGLFVLTIHTAKVILPTWLPPLHPRRKGLTHRGKDHLPWDDPRPRLEQERQTSGVPINFRSAARSALGPRPGTHANRPQPDPPGPAAPPRPPPPPLRLQPCAAFPRAFPPRGSLRPTSAAPHHAHRPAGATPPRANLLPSALPAAKPRVTPKPGGRRRRRRGSADAGWEEPGAEQPLG